MEIPNASQPNCSWLPALLQSCDSTFPTGAFANSFGLEGLVESGFVANAGDLERYLKEDLATSLIQLELPLLRLTAEAARRNDLDRLVELDELCQAFRSTAELRANSMRVGKRRLILLRDLSEEAEAAQLQEWLTRLPYAHQPIAAGLESHLLGFPLEAALHGYAFQAVNGAACASMKLLRIGQTTVQTLLARVVREIPGWVIASCAVEEAELGAANPFLDIASARHERAETRLFLS